MAPGKTGAALFYLFQRIFPDKREIFHSELRIPHSELKHLRRLFHPRPGVGKKAAVSRAVPVFREVFRPVAPAAAAAEDVIFAGFTVFMDAHGIFNEPALLFACGKRVFIENAAEPVRFVTVKIAGVGIAVCLNNEVAAADAAHGAAFGRAAH
jgi:hypothetical protein